jgi:coproporphyrinogen III oxidase
MTIAMSMKDRMEELSRRSQETVCGVLEALEGTPSAEYVYELDGGETTYVDRIIEGGRVFEKVSVNFAVVRGSLSPALARAAVGGAGLGDGASGRFFATGVSIVIHPRNPFVPSAHANYRYFELEDGGSWFGGGADLTPHYLFDDDARRFHRLHRDACDRHDPSFYPAFKARCDEYFHLPHRGESRGVGGIFFEHLNDRDPEALFAFVEDCAATFVPAYVPIVERHKDTPFMDAHRQWQALRRGRYAEFNLTCDRGIAFGLKSGGRVESILMALPPEARWEYGFEPAPESEEARLLEVLRAPRDWA